MQQYSPPTHRPVPPPIYAPAPANTVTWANFPPQRPQNTQKPLRSAMKKSSSTRTVWGGSTVNDWDDSATITGQTTTSIASSQSRAPGNEPSTQRRVEHWVDDTKHHTSDFRDPFAPKTAYSTPSSTGTKAPHSHRAEPRRERELPPVWVPRESLPASQLQTYPSSQPLVPMQQQYAQPQLLWVPAPAAAPPMSTSPSQGYFVAPPGASTVGHAAHGHSKSTSSGKGHGHGSRKRSH
ncbi:hypothetical protein C8R43DRAFT_1238917 [Mycena crocata]|nr:hypothetical protein C8R43DRAFT_1238917 [Mycena crocata]